MNRKDVTRQLVDLHSSLERLLFIVNGVRAELTTYIGCLASDEGSVDAIVGRLKSYLLRYETELETIHSILFGLERSGWDTFRIGNACYCSYEPRHVLKLIALYSPMNYDHIKSLLEGGGEALAEVVMSYLRIVEASSDHNLGRRAKVRLILAFRPAHWGYSGDPKEFLDVSADSFARDPHERLMRNARKSLAPIDDISSCRRASENAVF